MVSYFSSSKPKQPATEIAQKTESRSLYSYFSSKPKEHPVYDSSLPYPELGKEYDPDHCFD